MKKNFWLIIILFILCFYASSLIAQPNRWQQHIQYQIQVTMNVENNRLTGTETIRYTNNSPDTLNRVFFHLYWNAFQPGSMMDVRSRELGKVVLGTDRNGNAYYDWDPRVRDRISQLKPDEIGYIKVSSLKMNGMAQKLKEHETILEVPLNAPILPHTTVTMQLSFEAQVPVQIRRSGRNNAEGIQYSMSQWYPKMVEYDYQGWNANPYIAREFYGVWGNYDVQIKLPENYVIGATGTLQNANEIGHGYESKPITSKKATSQMLTWHFTAQNVHDFVWAADTAYGLIKKQIPKGPLIYVLYKKTNVNGAVNDAAWQAIADTAVALYPYIAKTFGAYLYPNYSFIQGGDGGMEYPMATLIKGPSIGTAIHEWMHSWYQGMIGTNESLYAWMDEGFASYAESRIAGHFTNNAYWYAGDYAGYFRLAKSGKEEPLSTHADHFNTNFAYSLGSYAKGAVFLEQLSYIVGNNNLDKILLEYYNQWHFKHPNPNDFIRIAEKVSGMELQWYKEYWIYTTKTIDYAIGNIDTENNKAVVTLKNIGLMPMPVDLQITYKDGTKEMHYIPMNLMYGTKPAEDTAISYFIHEEWKWTHPQYNVVLNRSVQDIKEIIIDPSNRMADINAVNNKITVP